MNSAERKNPGGAFWGSTMAQGSVKVDQDLPGVPFKFHVIADNVNLLADGVLGRFNMWNKSVLNFYKNELVFVDKSQKFLNYLWYCWRVLIQ